MRQSEIDSMKDTSPPKRVFPMAGFVIQMLLSLPVILACGGEGSGGSSGGSHAGP